MSEVRTTFDSEQFRREFQRRVARSRKSLAEIVNWTAFRILRRMIKLTRRGNRADIEALGLSHVIVFGKRGKKTIRLKKPRAVYHPTTQFRAIFAAQLRRRGVNPRRMGKGEFDAKMTRALTRRISSIGFIASGWLKPLKKILRALKDGGSLGEVPKTFSTTLSDATPAKENSWSPRAEFYNATAMNNPNNSPASVSRVEKILGDVADQAFAEEGREMERFGEKLLNEALGG